MKEFIQEWKELFSKKWLADDLFAGIIVACVAIPLSLAIALASNVPPEAGIISAIVAGIVCALFGSSKLAVSGPAAAMAVLIATAVQKFGLSSLYIIGIGCGILQLATGIFRLGFLIRLIPMPVIAGFTAGIGAIILISQFPRILGLPPIADSHLTDVILYINHSANQIKWPAFWLAALTITITFALPRLLPRFPASLVAIITAALIPWLFNIPIETIGNIPKPFESLILPSFSIDAATIELLADILLVYMLASLETLLSSSAIDKMTRTKPYHPDRELIGQGLGNIASALFGGIPVTSVIARSALNVQAGAKTRRAAIFHAMFLLIAVYFLASQISLIPIAALAGILISVALRMCHPREFLEFWHTSHSEAFIYLVTFIVIISADLLAGVQIGIAAALIIALLRLAYVKTTVHQESDRPTALCIDGPLTFLSVTRLDSMIAELTPVDLEHGVIFDLSRVPLADTSGATHLIQIIEQLEAKSIRIALQGVKLSCRKILLSIKSHTDIARLIATDEAELLEILHLDKHLILNRLSYGVETFKKHHRHAYKFLFKKLAREQNPHTFFITCSDSRINPNLITSTAPGELFVLRNVGNIIPTCHTSSTYGESAAIEFALGLLNVKEIVICAHSGCGAIKELITGTIFNPENQLRFPGIANWLKTLYAIRDEFPAQVTPEQAAKLNALFQMEQLKTYPLVQEKLNAKAVRIRIWYYDIGKAELEEWDEQENMFIVIGSEEFRALERRMQSGSQYQSPVIPD
ncbi:MAG: hypothetical protein A3F42_03220 [Gammaproteobacteria bacterium RIFCSPHIGHO2_12_FULL_37_34]|nr:MAG: hypothetical protein A3F42_03220 [Gammaproteobacteria bacterium RIFCSPHIGHO2_12_FULL_37_34]